MAEEIFRYENVSIAFGAIPLLTGFNLTVKKGDKVLLKGPSGKGKSTLLRMIPGFSHPTTGTVYYREKHILSSTIHTTRREVAYISQDTDIGEDLVSKMIDDIFSFEANEKISYIEKLPQLLHELELDESILSKRFTDLSGGEKQRIAIIIALLLERTIYILDEVTSALDPTMKKRVANLFLSRDEWTILVVSHDTCWIQDGVRSVPLKEAGHADA
ncbi:hypothetical protein AZH53_02345 [Methanomicrobiaceae archaeon CYW5]|uniref:ABC transporter ATP-binding protein n=1 Tax=Methanovulcanius yangii TaxID=1789227 RepID=UPI0029CA0075|nr:ABC transporter ATP-binding protein [Methanovulcanius yangii]MBT8507270.1 hypothetical protein [Methanovulcanius yangii]